MEGQNTQIKEEDQLSIEFQSVCFQPQEQDQEHIINLLLAMGKPPFLVQELPVPRLSPYLKERQQIQQKILSYNRKDKSLEELSRKFIENFEGRDGFILELDKVTVQLNVERRRIYDIVNIFESMKVVKKAAKNNYVWRGLKEAINTIRIFSQNGPDSPSLSQKKEKSLQNLASRFLKLFIFVKEPLSLEDAAKLLIVSQDFTLAKTKIRRLYDIVNVFKSIGLVQKVQLGCKKSGFRWRGTHILQEIVTQKSQQYRQKVEDISQMKENNSCLGNGFNIAPNINSWFSIEEKQIIAEQGFMKQFSQKVFYPAIIQQASARTLSSTQEIVNDLCPQY